MLKFLRRSAVLPNPAPNAMNMALAAPDRHEARLHALRNALQFELPRTLPIVGVEMERHPLPSGGEFEWRVRVVPYGQAKPVVVKHFTYNGKAPFNELLAKLLLLAN